MNWDAQGLFNGLTALEDRMERAVEAYGQAAGQKLEAWAKNPPYPEKPEKHYTEKQLILFKVLMKKGKIKPHKIRGDAGPYKWKTRTGKARQTITGGAEWVGDKMRVYVSGNVEYFQYLEFAMEKRYAVLEPARKALEPEIVQGMTNLLNQ